MIPIFNYELHEYRELFGLNFATNVANVTNIVALYIRGIWTLAF